VLLLAGAEAALLIVFVSEILSSSDPLGRAIGRGVAALAAIPAFACVLPALLLGLLGRWLFLALALAVAAVPLWLLIMHFA
jgi:hypothetical protein